MFGWLFQKQEIVKNVLVLGNSGSGKRSFIYRYKDDNYSERHRSLPINSIDMLQKWQDPDEEVQLHFVVDRSPEPQHGFRKIKPVQFDLILILIDLSSREWKYDTDWYSRHAQIHYHGIIQFLIGTKADIKLPTNEDVCFLQTSSKTGEGFDIFREQFKSAVRDGVVTYPTYP